MPTAPESPWLNPYVERLIGSIRRECLDHLVVINSRHLHRILGRYFDYYHRYERRAALSYNQKLWMAGLSWAAYPSFASKHQVQAMAGGMETPPDVDHSRKSSPGGSSLTIGDGALGFWRALRDV